MTFWTSVNDLYFVELLLINLPAHVHNLSKREECAIKINLRLKMVVSTLVRYSSQVSVLQCRCYRT